MLQAVHDNLKLLVHGVDSIQPGKHFVMFASCVSEFI